MYLQVLIFILLTVMLLPNVTVEACLVKENMLSNVKVDKNSASIRLIIVPKDFEKIQSAINAANDRDIIFVRAGTYYESIVLNKSILLLGAGYHNTIVDANKTANVITIPSDNAVVAGFTFQNGGSPKLPHLGYGIKIDNVDNVTVSDNFVSRNYIGIMLGDKQRGSNGNIIRNNIITKNRYGIFADRTNETWFYGNVITENSWNGVEIARGGRNVLQANNISYNSAYGLEIYSSTPSLYNRIFHNNFVNNSFKVSVSNLPNIWDDGYPSGGNYWSDYNPIDEYSGPDQNELGADGIADQPWIIDLSNHDRYPLVNPFDIPTSPVANFFFCPESPRVGEKITFNASASFSYGREIISYNWYFGDGNATIGAIATHMYSENGTFAVFLNVTDSNGLWSFQMKLIRVYERVNSLLTDVEHVIVVSLATTFIIIMVIYLARHRCGKPLQKSTERNLGQR